MKGGGETAHLVPRSSGDIPVVTLQDLWDRFQPTKIDVLVVDVEGHEEQVLHLQEIPTPKPRYILFEMVHLQFGVKSRIDDTLRKQGYVPRADLIHNDRVARRNNGRPQDRLYSLLAEGETREPFTP